MTPKLVPVPPEVTPELVPVPCEVTLALDCDTVTGHTGRPPSGAPPEESEDRSNVLPLDAVEGAANGSVVYPLLAIVPTVWSWSSELNW